MDFRYCIVNDCLVLVRQGTMPQKEKLRLEALLYRMKRLLLTDTAPVASSNSCGIQPYAELLQLVDAACSKEYGQCALSDVTDHVHIILGRLDGDNLHSDKDSAPRTSQFRHAND